MRKQVAFAGSISKIEQKTDNISLPVYTIGVVMSFGVLQAAMLILSLLSLAVLDKSQLWREAVIGTMFLWCLPAVLIIRAALVGIRYIVVVNESERVEHHYIRVNKDVIPRDDLHDWLIHIKLHGTTGQRAFRDVVLRSGNASSDERYRQLKDVFARADLIIDKGGKAGWELVNGPDFAAHRLGLPPLLVPSIAPKNGSAGRQNTARQSVMSRKP